MESLSKQVIEANDNHKKSLDQYIAKLEAELNTANQLIGAVENLSDDNLQQDHGDKWCLHTDGAFKPSGIIDVAEALDERSPFFNDALRRERYTNALAPSPFSASERRYLEKAIIKENKRLTAIDAQQRGQDAFAAVSVGDESFLENTNGLNWVAIARDVSASNNATGTRTAQECKVRWLGAQHPKINNQPWSEEEEKQLQNLVESKQDSGQVDWEEVAAALNTNRTALDCIKRYQASNRSTFRWTSARDKNLLEAVEKYGSGNWVLIASSVSQQVSANQCQIRYERTLNPEIKRGKFTSEEDILLLQAVEAHGLDWVKVAQAVPGRTNAQCRGRYTSHLIGDAAKTPWNLEEDARLREAVDKHGQQWDRVCEKMGASRHQSQYATRYRTLMRNDPYRKDDRDGDEQISTASAPQSPAEPPDVGPIPLTQTHTMTTRSSKRNMDKQVRGAASK